VNDLTPIEREMCKHMASGKLNKQVAQALHVTVSCIEKWKRALARRLHMSTKELLIWSVRNEASLNTPGN
jgi:DNA-binding NarL/FixJ family response regulator